MRSLEDLKKFSAGPGRFWGDTQILKANQIPVVTPVKYHNLFPMLEGGRFDYFPRAVHEPWNEVVANKELNLKVEYNLLLVYPFAMYLFVSKQDRALHDKIYQGLELAIQDAN